MAAACEQAADKMDDCEQVGKSGASVTHNVCFSNRPVWVKRLQTIHHSSFDVTSAAGRRPLQDANSRCRRTGDKCPLWGKSRHVRRTS